MSGDFNETRNNKITILGFIRYHQNGVHSNKVQVFLSINLPYNMLYTYLLIQIIIFVY